MALSDVVLVPQTEFVPQTDWKAWIAQSFHTAAGFPDTAPWLVTEVPQTLLVPQTDEVPQTEFEAVTS